MSSVGYIRVYGYMLHSCETFCVLALLGLMTDRELLDLPGVTGIMGKLQMLLLWPSGQDIIIISSSSSSSNSLIGLLEK